MPAGWGGTKPKKKKTGTIDGGFLADAQNEYAEANLALALVAGRPLATPAQLGVPVQPFLGGLAADRLSVRFNDRRWYMWVPGIATGGTREAVEQILGATGELAANPGEPARPLRKVASGGEMSRTMLALKTVLAAHDQVATLVFDEIDANVGGRLGDVLGEKLAGLGQSHQVICVTHLPQVAAFADAQVRVAKQSDDATTVSSAAMLDDDERVVELSRMLSGQPDSDAARTHAAELLATAAGERGR